MPAQGDKIHLDPLAISPENADYLVLDGAVREGVLNLCEKLAREENPAKLPAAFAAIPRKFVHGIRPFGREALFNKLNHVIDVSSYWNVRLVPPAATAVVIYRILRDD